MKAMNNPFNPSFGKVPPIYIDRTAQIEELVSELRNPDSPYQTTLVYGNAGHKPVGWATWICPPHFPER